jgi:hypothetical protein
VGHALQQLLETGHLLGELVHLLVDAAVGHLHGLHLLVFFQDAQLQLLGLELPEQSIGVAAPPYHLLAEPVDLEEPLHASGGLHDGHLGDVGLDGLLALQDSGLEGVDLLVQPLLKQLLPHLLVPHELPVLAQQFHLPLQRLLELKCQVAHLMAALLSLVGFLGGVGSQLLLEFGLGLRQLGLLRSEETVKIHKKYHR